MITLRQAVNRSIVLKIKYFPNKDGQVRVGFRTVLPLDLYTYRGVQYMLTWFTEGSSVSGEGTGYRLFFVKNIQEFEETDTTKQQPFALMKEFQSKNKSNWKVSAWHMIKAGKVE